MQHTDPENKERPTVIHELINFEVPRAWLENCEKAHKPGCGQGDLTLRHLSPIDVILVDVIQNCISRKTTASKYFALSYVWGAAVDTITTMQNLTALEQPGSLTRDLVLPKPVSDAILITKNMGYGISGSTVFLYT
jgi:hypothetical protein